MPTRSGGRRIAVVVITVILNLALLVYVGPVALLGALSGMLIDGCAAACNPTQLEWGAGLASVGPLVVAVVAIVWSIVWLILRRRLAWVIVLGGILGVTLISLAGVTIAYAGIGQSFWSQS